MKNTDKFIAIGLMSGTSLDGVDTALIKTDGENYIEYIDSYYQEYSAEFREAMQQCAKEDIPLNDVLRLEKQLTEFHIDAVNALAENREVDVIGFHGQTIRHLPDEGLTWQLGNPNLLAEKTNIPVVADFRRRDMAAGGQGAPLVPLFHKALFSEYEKPFMVLNIGGVANFTFVGENDEVIAGDTGPGMGLIDACCLERTGKFYDENGKLAIQGNVNVAILNKAMKLPYFNKPYPKSADRYEFDSIDVSGLNTEDALATLCYITVKAIEMANKYFPNMPECLYVTGGGAKNPVIMNQLSKCYKNVQNVDAVGLRMDTMEAECFAWLAVRRLKNLPFTSQYSTACQHGTCGGILTV